MDTHRISDKLRGRGGETLVETLAAIAVIVLSVGMLFTGAAASAKLNRSLNERKAARAEEMYAAEFQNDEDLVGEANLRITFAAGDESDGTAEIAVGLYGSPESGIYSYRPLGSGGE